MSNKYQREIEEILEKAGDLGKSGRRAPKPKSSDAEPGFFRLAWLYARQSLSGRLFSISPGRIMLIGVVLVLSTLLVRPFVGGLSGWLGWAGLLLFIVGYGMVLVRPPKVQMEKRWRGEPIEDEDDSWLGKLRRKLRIGS